MHTSASGQSASLSQTQSLSSSHSPLGQPPVALPHASQIMPAGHGPERPPQKPSVLQGRAWVRERQPSTPGVAQSELSTHVGMQRPSRQGRPAAHSASVVHA